MSIRHRLPWLLVGLGGAMATAVAVGAFEDQLERNVLNAFFVPAVVYIAAAVGTQTELVLIRAMSAGVRVRSVVGRELVTGTALGAVVAIAFCAFALVTWGDDGLGLSRDRLSDRRLGDLRLSTDEDRWRTSMTSGCVGTRLQT